MSTLTQLIARVRRETDLLDEPAVTDTEITQYLNEGIDVAEAKIMELYEDYFRKRGTAINLVSGTAEYSYPTDMWGNKFRALIYRNGSIICEIPRIGDNELHSFEDIEITDATAVWSPESMRYIALQTTFKLTPAPTASQTAVLIPWYLSQATTLVSGSDSCNIIEWEHVVVAYAKNEIAFNKPGLGDPSKTAVKLEALVKAMESSLSNRVPDEWDFVAKDMSTYEEHT